MRLRSPYKVRLVDPFHDPGVRRDLRRLDRELFEPETLVISAGHLWWFVERGDEIVAYASLEPRVADRLGFLDRAAVLPDHRGQGLQRYLIRVREEHAYRLGIRRLVGYTHYRNVQSANNLFRCGYSLYLPKKPWGVRGALYFQRRLEERAAAA